MGCAGMQVASCTSRAGCTSTQQAMQAAANVCKTWSAQQHTAHTSHHAAVSLCCIVTGSHNRGGQGEAAEGHALQLQQESGSNGVRAGLRCRPEQASCVQGDCVPQQRAQRQAQQQLAAAVGRCALSSEDDRCAGSPRLDLARCCGRLAWVLLVWQAVCHAPL